MAMNLDRANELILSLERENKILRDELAILKQGLFGRKSERLDPGQLALFLRGDESVADAPAIVESSSSEASAVRKQAAPGHGRSHFPEHLPRDTIPLDVPEAERACPCCGKQMRAIGEDITERGHMVPARIVVRRFVRKKYACPDGHAVKTASLPDGVIDGAKYEASVYAHVATAKYADHLPLHRLQGIFKRHGVDLLALETFVESTQKSWSPGRCRLAPPRTSR